MTTHDTRLFISGRWRPSASDAWRTVENPATTLDIGRVAIATPADLDEAADASAQAFRPWREMSAHARADILRRAGAILRSRSEAIARMMTLEQGKPLQEARGEVAMSADTLDWFAEEGRRAYGRLIPPRLYTSFPLVAKEPIGPVAAFTPWNLPVAQVVRKVAAALAAGCTIVVKGPEETPASPAALVRALEDAGAPSGIVNLVYGDPAAISAQLIAHPRIRKVSFTGSVSVGKALAVQAAQLMKPATMELGGHAPVIVCANASLGACVDALIASKFRNAGQTCISPTRFLIERPIYDAFVETFAKKAKSISVGDGLEAATKMGPLVSERRMKAVEHLVADAQSKGGEIVTGGRRLEQSGYFYPPTIIAGANAEMKAMNEEPFGPVALMTPFDDLDEALSEANRLPYGLGAYAFTGSLAAMTHIAKEIEAGMIRFNQLGAGGPETPFGGIKDSGAGWECGSEGLDMYLSPKLISIAV